MVVGILTRHDFLEKMIKIEKSTHGYGSMALLLNAVTKEGMIKEREMMFDMRLGFRWSVPHFGCEKISGWIICAPLGLI